MKRLFLIAITVAAIATIAAAAFTSPAASIRWWDQTTYSNLNSNTLKAWVDEAEALIETGALSTDGNTITFGNGGTISNLTNGAIILGEASEDLILTFTTNSVAATTSTGLNHFDFGAVNVCGKVKVVTTTTTPTAVIATYSGGTYVSYGVAAGAANCVFTLPTAVAGLTYTFVDANSTAADDLWITAASGDTINGGTAGKSYKCTGDAVKQSVTITAIDATRWEIVAELGTWSNDNS